MTDVNGEPHDTDNTKYPHLYHIGAGLTSLYLAVIILFIAVQVNRRENVANKKLIL